MEFVEVGLEMRKTLMIQKVPRVMCKIDELKRHFLEAYPDVIVKNITFAYNVQKLQNIYNELKDAKSALKYCNKHDVLDKEPFYVYRVSSIYNNSSLFFFHSFDRFDLACFDDKTVICHCKM